jgi:hypothetical protein
MGQLYQPFQVTKASAAPRLPRPPHGRFTLRPLGQLPTCLVGRPDLQPLPFINSFVLKGSIAR